MLNETLYIFILTASLLSCKSHSNKDSNENKLENSSLSISQKEILKTANSLYEAKEYAEAKKYYDTLISLDSTNGEYYFKRGYCKSSLLNDDEGAIEDYFKSIKYNYRKKQSSYINIGVLHRSYAVFNSLSNQQRIAEYDTAIYFYNEALKIDPENESALKEKQEVQENLKRLNQ